MTASNTLHRRSRFVLWIWLASVSLVVAGSLTPNLHIKAPVDNPDKLLHAAAYTWLAFLPRIGLLSSSQALYLGLGLLCLGFGVELAQIPVPGRFFSWLDMAANTAGVILGLCLAAWIETGRRQSGSLPPSGQ